MTVTGIRGLHVQETRQDGELLLRVSDSEKPVRE